MTTKEYIIIILLILTVSLLLNGIIRTMTPPSLVTPTSLKYNDRIDGDDITN